LLGVVSRSGTASAVGCRLKGLSASQNSLNGVRAWVSDTSPCSSM
jgi:hypothetical protein